MMILRWLKKLFKIKCNHQFELFEIDHLESESSSGISHKAIITYKCKKCDYIKKRMYENNAV